MSAGRSVQESLPYGYHLRHHFGFSHVWTASLARSDVLRHLFPLIVVTHSYRTTKLAAGPAWRLGCNLFCPTTKPELKSLMHTFGTKAVNKTSFSIQRSARVWMPLLGTSLQTLIDRRAMAKRGSINSTAANAARTMQGSLKHISRHACCGAGYRNAA